MALTDFLATPFLLYLGITLIIIGTISMFFMRIFNEQNHKLVSMVELVSSMVSEVNYLKHKSNFVSLEKDNLSLEKNIILKNSPLHDIHNETMKTDGLIDVSDDDSDSDSETEDDDSDSELDDKDTVSEDTDDDSVHEYKDDMELTYLTKKINIGNDIEKFVENEVENEVEIFVDNDIENNIENDIKIINISEDFNLIFECDEVENIKEELYTLDENKDDDDNLIDEMQVTATQNISNILTSIKTIKMDDNELKEETVKEYKKMSINDLRVLVLDKKLVPDSSKLKKNELMKLLETNVTTIFQNNSNQISLSEINI